MQDFVRAVSEGKNGSHISGIAAVALADAMIDSWFFGGSKKTPPIEKPETIPEFLTVLGITPESWKMAQRMAEHILVEQVESNSTDVNENAVQFVVDWVLSNKAYFGAKAIGTCLGMTSDQGNIVYIYPSLLNQALSKAGYSPRKTMKYMAERGLVTTTINKKGKREYQVIKWFGDRSERFVEFFIGKIAPVRDPIDDIDDDSGNESTPEYSYTQTEKGEQIYMPEDDDLPF